MTNGWKTEQLGDVLVKTETVDPLRKPDCEFDYVDVSSVSNQTFRIEETQCLKGKDAPSRARRLIRAKDVLFATVRPTLRRIAIVPDELDEQVCSTGYFVLRAKPQVDHRYVFYFLQTEAFMDAMEALQKGASYPAVTDGEVRVQPIPVPPLAEQQRIVGLLDEAFAGLATAKAHAEKNLQNARALFESHLQSVFTQRGLAWVEKPLAELCEIKHGYAFEGEFFSSTGEYVLLTPGSFYESGGYRDRGEKQKFYTGEIPRAYVLNEGDLLVAMTEQAAGLLGSPLLVPKSDKFLHNQRLGLVTKKPSAPWTNEFFFHVFNTQAVRQAIHDSASGVKVRHTSPTKIGEVIVAFPTSLTEQKEIVATLASLREETQRLATLYTRKLAVLEALKKSLLHQAFTGELTRAWRESKIIPFPSAIAGITTTDLHAGILAMAYRRHEQHGKQADFGHVKAEKIAHLIEAHAGIELGRCPVKDAAGPNDFRHLKGVEHRAKMADFFSFLRMEGAAYRVTKLPKFDDLIARTDRALGDRRAEVDRLLDVMVKMDWRQAEIFATVFAAWNNLLLDGQEITDERIVTEAREHWHPEKLKIPREKFFKAIEWMKQHELVPIGRGKLVMAKTEKKVNKAAAS